MENRIELVLATHFDLSDAELIRLYTALGLLQYKYDRNPDYDEQAVLRRLRNDFNRFNKELIKIREKDPNNLLLSQVQNFMQRHYGNLRDITNE